MNDGDYIRVRYQQQQQPVQQQQGPTGPQGGTGPQQEPQIEVEERYSTTEPFGRLQKLVDDAKRENPLARGPLKVIGDVKKTPDGKPILNVYKGWYSGTMIFKVIDADNRELATLEELQPTSQQKLDEKASESEKAEALGKARDKLLVSCLMYKTAINGKVTDDNIKLLRQKLGLGGGWKIDSTTESSSKTIKLAVIIDEEVTRVEKSKVKGQPDKTRTFTKQRTIELPNIIYIKCTENNKVIWKEINPDTPIQFNASDRRTWEEYKPDVFLEDDETVKMLHSDNIVQEIDLNGPEERSKKLGDLIKRTRHEGETLGRKFESVKNHLVDNQGNFKPGYQEYLKHQEIARQKENARQNAQNFIPPGVSIEKRIYDNEQNLPLLNTTKQENELKIIKLKELITEINIKKLTNPSDNLKDFAFFKNVKFDSPEHYKNSVIKSKIAKFIETELKTTDDLLQETEKEIAKTNKLISDETKTLFDAGRPFTMNLESLDETQASLMAMGNQYDKLLIAHGRKEIKLSDSDLKNVMREANSINAKISDIIKFKAELKNKPLEQQIQSLTQQVQQNQSELQTLQQQIAPLEPVTQKIASLMDALDAQPFQFPYLLAELEHTELLNKQSQQQQDQSLNDFKANLNMIDEQFQALKVIVATVAAGA